MATLVQISKASKSYGGQVLLENADAVISDTTKIGFVGRNGAGKSTLLRILLGEEELDSGEVIRHPNLRKNDALALPRGRSWYNPDMEAIIRNVRDIETSERRVLEHVVGRQLKENEQIIIQIVTLGKKPAAAQNQADAAPSSKLPPWCNVYEGLSDDQIAEVEEVILQRADLTRPSE